MIAVTEEIISAITRTIIESVHPLKIILFGSYARGDAGPGSDLDFLIVAEEPFGPERSRFRRVGDIYRKLPDYLVPVDILLYSNNEFDTWKDSINHVIARANREGKVIYEQS